MISRAAIRISAVEALRGRTLAGQRVLDSDIGSVDDVASERNPFIAVYTDEETAEGLALVFEFGVTARMRLVDPDTNMPIDGDGVPETDGEIELGLDMIQRQIHVALADPQNDWADCLRGLFGKPTATSLRGADSKDGVRFAARQLRLVGQAQLDPPFGRPIVAGSCWARFMALVEASDAPGLPEKAAMFASLFGTARPLTDWRLFQAALRQSGPVTDALGQSRADASWPAEITTTVIHPAAEETPGGLA